MLVYQHTDVVTDSTDSSKTMVNLHSHSTANNSTANSNNNSTANNNSMANNNHYHSIAKTDNSLTVKQARPSKPEALFRSPATTVNSTLVEQDEMWMLPSMSQI